MRSNHFVFFIGALLTLVPLSQANAQYSEDLSNRVGFTSYLIENKEYRDAINWMRLLETDQTSLSNGAADTLTYYTGWSHFCLNQFDSSFTFLNRVRNTSPFYYRSRFYGSLAMTLEHQTEAARRSLHFTTTAADSETAKLRDFELSGIALLDRDYKTFDSLSRSYDFQYYPIAEEQKNFMEYANRLQSIRRRSPVVAGFLSALIPGAGKVYAGFPMQALSAFAQTAALGVAAAESYIKAGPKSARFIVFGSIFSLVYLGNIWGSALSVQVKREQKFNEIDQTILFDLRIPLRRVFN